ncbi:MAG: magnesium/cobalt transporter CorA [Saprospiraceae bacterium]|nr:magnesium/cobalt transporter CorA [Saprospiraceae bacterium]
MSNKNIPNKKVHKRKSKTGLPPGTHIYTGKNLLDKPEIQVFSYGIEFCNMLTPDVDELLKMDFDHKTWINIEGLHDVELIRSVCDKFGIHHLYQEDILNVYQRPKVEEEDHYLFTTFKSLGWNDQQNEIELEQISMVLSGNTVITFQEKLGDHYDALRERLQTEKSIIREKTIDYLFYRILDITVDVYFDILEKMGDYLEIIENEVINQPANGILLEIQNNKKDIMQLRKNIYPMRDVMNKLANVEHPLINEKTKKYFKDVLDHTVQILENVETYRDINVSLKDVYLNALSHDMNKVMKILTIISTFFIPLTFIVGVYGMNFRYMPELEWVNGYYIIWGIMIAIVILLSIWFKRKGWF